MSKTAPMALPRDVLRAAQDLEYKRQSIDHAHEQIEIKRKALAEAKSEARRANEVLASAEQDLINAEHSLKFAEVSMSRYGVDLLIALKEANLFPEPSVTCPTVGKEPDHDHDPPPP